MASSKVLSLEIQNDFDQRCTLKDKIVTKGSASFHPTGDQSISSNGGKADLTIVVADEGKMEAKFILEFVTVYAHCLVVWNEGSLPKFYSERSDPKQLAVTPQDANVQGNTVTMVVKCSYAQ